MQACNVARSRETTLKASFRSREDRGTACFWHGPRSEANTHLPGGRRRMYTNGGRGSRDEKAPAGLHYHPAALGSLFEVKVNPRRVSRTRTCIQHPYTCIRRALRAISMGIRPAGGPGLHPKDNPKCPLYVLLFRAFYSILFSLSLSLSLSLSRFLCFPLNLSSMSTKRVSTQQHPWHSPYQRGESFAKETVATYPWFPLYPD